jgi:two-component system, OmpR family, sensor histidine kinase MprB
VTFRWKLAVAFALLSAVAIGACAVTAYEVTESHLGSEIDLSLQQAASQLGRAGPPAPPPPGPAGAPITAAVPGGGLTRTSIPANRPNGAPLGLLALVAIQRLSPSGKIVSTEGPVALPVSAGDRELAAHGGLPMIRTSDAADGEPYRIETVPIPRGGAFELGRDLGENDALLGTLRWLFALADLIVTVVAACAGWMIAGRITRRLAHLTTNAEAVAETGQLRLPIDSSGSDEVGRLARAFTLMLSALQRSRDEQQALAQNAEHELRTPLTSMRTNIDLLRRHPDLPPTTKDAVLSDLDGELQELTSLVNELVELASDQPSTEMTTPVRLDELGERLAERFRARTGREVAVEVSPTTVEGSAKDLERAISNLIDNAGKFSPIDTPIELVVTPGRVELRDRGMGVAEDDADRIFDRFYRSASARSAPGSGLGLAIVRRVAESLGGSVFAQARAGGGACIGFTFPVASRSDGSSSADPE